MVFALSTFFLMMLPKKWLVCYLVSFFASSIDVPRLRIMFILLSVWYQSWESFTSSSKVIDLILMFVAIRSKCLKKPEMRLLQRWQWYQAANLAHQVSLVRTAQVNFLQAVPKRFNRVKKLSHPQGLGVMTAWEASICLLSVLESGNELPEEDCASLEESENV